MSESFIVEIWGEPIGIVLQEGEAFRFHATSSPFFTLDGEVFSKPGHARLAAARLRRAAGPCLPSIDRQLNSSVETMPLQSLIEEIVDGASAEHSDPEMRQIANAVANRVAQHGGDTSAALAAIEKRLAEWATFCAGMGAAERAHRLTIACETLRHPLVLLATPHRVVIERRHARAHAAL